MDDQHYLTIDFGVNFAHQKRYPQEKLDTLLKDSWDAGVDKVVSISNTIKEAKINLKLAETYDNLHFTVGIHPHDAKSFKPEDVKLIEDNLSHPKCFGVGECGLDFNRNFSPPDQQKQVFEIQVELAKKHQVNLYLHCRDAYDDFISILKKHEYYRGLMHCFTGNIDQALELTSLGFRLGITGWIFDKRRNQDLVKVIVDPRITLDMLVVETDAPFMPVHRKRKESVPADTGRIVEEIARLKGIDNVQCGKTIYKNSIEWLTK